MSCGRKVTWSSLWGLVTHVALPIVLMFVGLLTIASLAGGCSAVEAPVSAAPMKNKGKGIVAETIVIDGTTRCVVVGTEDTWLGGKIDADSDLVMSCDWKPAAPPTPQRSPYPLEPEQQPGRVGTR